MNTDQDRIMTFSATLEAARRLRMERDELLRIVAAYEARFGPLDDGFASAIPSVHAAGITCDWPEPEPPAKPKRFAGMAALVTAAAGLALLWVAL